MNNPFGTQTMFNAREVFSGGKSKSTSMVKGYEQPSAYTPALNKNFMFPIWAKDINLWMTHMDCPLYIAGPTGAGKCLEKGTPVLKADGTIVPVEDVKVGDLLLGPDSRPRRVESLAHGQEQMYRIHPNKGAPFGCNASHILSLQIIGEDNVRDCYGVSHKPGDIVNISVADYLNSSKTFRYVAKGWRAPAVDFISDHVLDIPPYILGVWLGDGRKQEAVIYNVDHEVTQEWDAYTKSLGCTVVAYGDPMQHRMQWRAVADMRGTDWRFNRHPFLEKLRAYGLLGNKHIPIEYLTASQEDRKELLAGLLDTDGYLNRNCYDFVNKYQQIAEGVAFLARSLGLAAYVKQTRKQCTNTGAWGTYWRVSISGDLDIIPCRVERRKAEARKQRKSVRRFGFTIEDMGVGEYYGFTLSGPDHLFLLGDFTVTHNTAAVKYIAALLNYPVLEVTGHSRLEFPELVGHYTVVNGSMQWVDGPLTMAMKYGGIFLLNEIDLLDPSTAAGLNSILDGSPLVIPELGGLAVYPDPYFRFIATGNSNGAGDTTGRYQGVLAQNMAFLDRFMLIVADYLPREMEIKALAKAEPSLPEELLSQLVFFANDVRRMFIGAGDTGESCEVTMSTRTLLRTAELIRLYSPMKAYGVDVVVEALNRALLFKASPATRNTLLELLQRIRGESH